MVSVGFSTTHMALSKAIRWITNAPASHCFVLFDFDGIPMVLEAAFEGVRLVPMASFEKRNIIVALIPVPYSEDDLKPLFNDLGDAYDFGGLLGSFFVQAGRWFKRRWRNPWASRKAMFCSEAIAWWLQDLKYPGTENLEPDMISPKDLLVLLRPNT